MGKKNERIEREVKLVNAVHGLPRLCQKSDKKYSDQNSKVPIWSKLAKDCGFRDGKEASTAWKNLRKTYVNRLNKMKASTGSGLDDVQVDVDDYKYAEELAFLLPETEDRPSRSTLDKQPSTDDNDGDDPEYVGSEDEDEEEEERAIVHRVASVGQVSALVDELVQRQPGAQQGRLRGPLQASGFREGRQEAPDGPRR
ncbi:hypothetical protein AAVH_37799, partial [Aphelenchoides avenae]